MHEKTDSLILMFLGYSFALALSFALTLSDASYLPRDFPSKIDYLQQNLFL